MRTVVAQALLADVTLQGLGVNPDSLVAGDVDTPPMRPFINLRWDDVNPGVGTVNSRRLTIWVHDAPNDYELIDSILGRIRTVLNGLEAVRTTHGWLTLIEWNGNSPDLSDDGHGTITRNSSYTLVGSGV